MLARVKTGADGSIACFLAKKQGWERKPPVASGEFTSRFDKAGENVCIPNVIKLSIWNVRDILNEAFSSVLGEDRPNSPISGTGTKTAEFSKMFGFLSGILLLRAKKERPRQNLDGWRINFV